MIGGTILVPVSGMSETAALRLAHIVAHAITGDMRHTTAFRRVVETVVTRIGIDADLRMLGVGVCPLRRIGGRLAVRVAKAVMPRPGPYLAGAAVMTLNGDNNL